MSHSKRNTSLAFFTSYERSQLKAQWGSQSTRLTRDSFLAFAACNLCLSSARDPVACPTRGHVFCRECALSNLLAQRSEIKRIEKRRARRKEDDTRQEAERTSEKNAEEVESFERVVAGLEGGSSSGAGTERGGRAGGINGSNEKGSDEKAGMKRKRGAEDAADLNSPAVQKGQKADGNLNGTQNDDEDSSLPPWWRGLATADMQPVCPCSTASSPHGLSLNTLVRIQFSTAEKGPRDSNSNSNSNTSSNTEANSTSRVCPACSKPLVTGVAAVLAVPCGHVICKACRIKFLPSDGARDSGGAANESSGVAKESRVLDDERTLACYVCEADLSEKPKKKKDDKKKEKLRPGLVEIRSEGTGFAGGGKNVVKREGVVFQC